MTDHNDATVALKRLTNATGRLQKMVPEVAHARQIKEFVGDMKKNLLAKYMVPHLKAGESATAAEQYARADEGYKREHESLQEQDEAAEHAVASWQAEFASFEAARTITSYQKATMHELQG